MRQHILIAACVLLGVAAATAQHKTLREWGFPTGIFETGKCNAITDVPGVTVGHKTLIVGDSIRTGVTAIVPHQGNIFRNKVPAAIYVAMDSANWRVSLKCKNWATSKRLSY